MKKKIYKKSKIKRIGNLKDITTGTIGPASDGANNQLVS